ncbi:hypothetical protein WJX77_005226 [Trebouxia sp. C0004]
MQQQEEQQQQLDNSEAEGSSSAAAAAAYCRDCTGAGDSGLDRNRGGQPVPSALDTLHNFQAQPERICMTHASKPCSLSDNFAHLASVLEFCLGLQGVKGRSGPPAVSRFRDCGDIHLVLSPVHLNLSGPASLQCSIFKTFILHRLLLQLKEGAWASLSISCDENILPAI